RALAGERLHGIRLAELLERQADEEQRFALDVDHPPVRGDPAVRRAAGVDEKQDREIAPLRPAALVEPVRQARTRAEVGQRLDARVEVDFVAYEHVSDRVTALAQEW